MAEVSTNRFDGWLFFTIGVGDKNFESAANRLARQMDEFGIFAKVHVFKTDEILRLCPTLKVWYTFEELEQTKGFGWYVWKSKIADLVVREKILGTYKGYVYLDAGCEGYFSILSKMRLKKFIRNAEKNEGSVFSIPTPEVWHSKRAVLEALNIDTTMRLSYQIQSGSWFLLDGVKSSQIVQQWNELMKISPKMSDESVSDGGEYEDFRVHRYDQPAFSLICKRNGLSALKFTPPGSVTSILYYIRAFSYPFWWSRNRSGISQIPKFLYFLGKLSAFKVFDKYHR